MTSDAGPDLRRSPHPRWNLPEVRLTPRSPTPRVGDHCDCITRTTHERTP